MMIAKPISTSVEQSVLALPKAQKQKVRKFYRIRDYSGGGAGFIFENSVAIAPPGKLRFMSDIDIRGFPPAPEKPRFIFDKKLGRFPYDWEFLAGFWLVSERMKTLLEAVDPEGVAFLACETRMANGDAAPPFWLCEIMRVLDALDEENSEMPVEKTRAGEKMYNTAGQGRLSFKEDVVGSAHIFRMEYAPRSIIGDSLFLDACKASKIKGVRFSDASKNLYTNK